MATSRLLFRAHDAAPNKVMVMEGAHGKKQAWTSYRILAVLIAIILAGAPPRPASAASDSPPIAPNIPFLGCTGWNSVAYTGDHHDYPKDTNFPDQDVGDGFPLQSLVCHRVCNATVSRSVLSTRAMQRVQELDTLQQLDQSDPYFGTTQAPFYAIQVTCRDPSKIFTQKNNPPVNSGPSNPTPAPPLARIVSATVSPTLKFGPSPANVADVTAGTFDTDFGVLNLGRYSGSYSHNGGKVTIAGRSGPTIDGDWEELSGTQRCADGHYRGHFHFEFSQAGFTGGYGYCDAPANAGHWNGARR